MASYTDLLGPPRGAHGARHLGTTPQGQVLQGRAAEMTLNAAGGYTFTIDDTKRLRRFLILGTTTGTYYVSADKLGQEAMDLLDRCLANDPIETVNTIVEVSVSGAPLKQSPCIFAIARACSMLTGDRSRDSDNKDPVTRGRTYALAQAPQVLRTYSHVFEFLDYCRRQRGAGPGLLRMLSEIMTTASVSDVEYQSLKYRNRNNWTPRDLLRFAHAKSPDHSDLFGYLVKPESEAGRRAVNNSARLAAYEQLQDLANEDGPILMSAAQLITDAKFTHEFVPNSLLSRPDVWEALLPNLPLTALTRNLRKMTQVGLLTDGSEAAKFVRDRLVNAENLKRARLHPLRILGAQAAYGSGTSAYGHGRDFIPSSEVIAILDDALNLSWTQVEPLGRNVVMAIDSSGSMSSPSPMAGLSSFHAGLALAVWYKRAEANCVILTYEREAKLVNVSKNVTFSEIKRIQNPGGGTDCSSPLRWLNTTTQGQSFNAEVVISLTDNDTWSGRSHFVEELSRLRQRLGHNVAAVVCATATTESSVCDPKDPHSLEIVGFDPTVPEAIAGHVKEVFE